MLQRAEPATAVDVFSVEELVSIRTETGRDPWCLSLVQRGQVWKEMQVAYLLDSLLFGYPIGSLLLCTVRHDGSVLEAAGDLRVRKAAPDGTWQLLDGQQRLNSLAWLFAGPAEPERRHFLVRLDLPRSIDDVTLRKRKQEEALRYIQLAGAADVIDERWRWLDVSGLYHASRMEAFPSCSEVDSATTERLLETAEQTDPLCTYERWSAADVGAKRAAADRLRRLLQAWYARAIPVVRLCLDGPLDVLQVFARVNRTGTYVAGDDVFFAGVKTLWFDAEEHVERVHQASQLLRRTTALRLLARVANHELGSGDLLPLDVERLHGDQGRKLVQQMECFAQANSRLLLRIRDISKWAIESSGLGHALNVVHPALFDHVFGWAVARNHWPPTTDDLACAWSYLFGASAFRYRQVFAEPFDRLAFHRALQAGAHNEPFPLGAIAGDCQVQWPGLRKSRQQIAKVTTQSEQRRFVNDNWNLALYIAQDVPYVLPAGRKLDWEHLYPVARVANMRWRGPDGSERLHRYEGANDLWHTGNLFALDESLNRSAQDAWPDEKLQYYEEQGLWPPSLFLSATERQDLLAACELFRKGKVADGMPTFRRYVKARELRLFEDLERRYPRAFIMAAEADKIDDSDR